MLVIVIAIFTSLYTLINTSNPIALSPFSIQGNFSRVLDVSQLINLLKLIDVILQTISKWLPIIAQVIGLGSLFILALTYKSDRKWKRAEAAYQFYNHVDTNLECKLAMFMIDYHSINISYVFKYYFIKLGREISVTYNFSKRESAMKKSYGDLTEEEQAIRYIFDVYIGYLARIVYLIEEKVFTINELVFYKYWLDYLVSDKCQDIYDYAKNNSIGDVNQFLKYYEEDLQLKLSKRRIFNN